MLDEFVHHGAEIALLRDLWRWQRITVGDDALVDRVVRGDASVLAEFERTPPPADLVDRAAAYGRWDLVVGLVERGAPSPRRVGRRCTWRPAPVSSTS